MVYDDLNYTEEAVIFANQQKNVKPLSPYEIFNANIEGDSDTQTVIKSIVESNGLRITTSRCHCGICAITCLESIYEKYGYHALDRTLKLIVGTWEGDEASLTASMLKGIAFIVFLFSDMLKDEYFIKCVGDATAREITRTAKDRGGGLIGYAESILLAYNKRANSKLPMGTLYETGKRVKSKNKPKSTENISLPLQIETETVKVVDEIDSAGTEVA